MGSNINTHNSQETTGLIHAAQKNGRVVAYAQLLRLPNVFTAMADVVMGYLVMRENLQPYHIFGLLAASSCLLYLAGMVLNDVYDVEEDARDRPKRPIPSGRISLAVARRLGIGLMAGGVGASWAAGMATASWRPGVVGTLLAVCIVLYDRLLKQTCAGPVAMGACRSLNVLLGMSLGALAAPHSWPAAAWIITSAIGIYTAGITWFARSEAQRSKRTHLVAGLVLMLAGLTTLALLPRWTTPSWLEEINNRGWHFFWIIIGLMIARRCAQAIANPSPARVQVAVKHAILSLITIDAAITLGFCGVFWGCGVLLLLAPAIGLGRWVYST